MCRVLSLSVALALCAAVVLPAHGGEAAAGALVVHVSPGAAAGGDGSPSRPFGSILQALEHLRRARSRDPRPRRAEILLGEGDYRVTSTIALGPDDSHLTIRAAVPGTARLTGGVRIARWGPVTDPEVRARLGDAAEHVMQTDLRSAGVDDFGRLSNRGFGRPVKPAHLELFFEGEPARLAGWPDSDWARIREVPAGPQSGAFRYEGDRPARWKDARDVWLHGYWTWDWADSYEQVESLDAAAGEVRTVPPHGVYGYKAGARFRFLNVMEELDSPGEFYMDRDSGILYFWPPTPLEGRTAEVSVLEEPMVTLAGTSAVVLPAAPRPVDFRFRPDAPVWKTGFRPIPLEKIGPRRPAASRP